MSTEDNNKNNLWYKDAIIYELHVRSFFDSNADGIGDFSGLIQKLDYLQFLGVTLIWLLPFYPSPLKDDGYDIMDFKNVNPSYGTMNDFKRFLHEAHKRNIKVMTELVLNHTSSTHPWFQNSRNAKPNSKWRNFYVWSDTDQLYNEARIIFKDFETSNWTWDPVANAYYWHRFYSHQPDLNFDNPQVQKMMLKIVDYWFELGVDGLRLDAIPYLFERENTNCENLVETHCFLKKLRKYIDDHYENRFILAEANQWPEDAVAYFGHGNECHMAFHFPVMPRMYMAIQMEDRFPLVDILQQTPHIPLNCQWAIFLRNHDELTLEMVTDEERDYMYRMYAKDHEMRINLGIRRRLSPLMNGDRKKIELMNALLFSLPGTPVIYYGDEIGMGDNIYLGDRNGVRTPMQWNGDRNAGFSQVNPQKLFLPVIIDPEYSFENINVQNQIHNSQSLLWWMKKLIALRKRFKAFGRGSIEFLMPENKKVLAFLRKYDEENILIVANLSRFSQCIELDLSEYVGNSLVELFGDNSFPQITTQPYLLTLSPYSFFYFKIEKIPEIQKESKFQYQPPLLMLLERKKEILDEDLIDALEKLLMNYIPSCRWFRAKSCKINSISIIERIFLCQKPYPTYLIFAAMEYKEQEEDMYLLPISLISEEEYDKLTVKDSSSLIAILQMRSGERLFIVDSLHIPAICKQFLVNRTKKFKGTRGGFLEAKTKSPFKHFFSDINESDILPLLADQTNSSVLFGNKLILKLYRRNDQGINPEVEMIHFLNEQSDFKQVPNIVSILEYKKKNSQTTVGVLQEFVANQGDAWKYTISALQVFYDEALTREVSSEKINMPDDFLCLHEDEAIDTYHLIDGYAESAYLLGKRTAELHLALASNNRDEFKKEQFSLLDQKSLYQSIRSQCKKSFDNLKKQLIYMDDSVQDCIIPLIKNQEKVFDLAREVLNVRIKGQKIRCHGDFHLGQILYTGKDFYIIDFEGEPARSLSERRIKRSPLKDVAGILRSFHYAVYTVIFDKFADQDIENKQLMETWGLYWYRCVCNFFLKAYFAKTQKSSLLPQDEKGLLLLLKLYMLEKAVYEIEYEINNRPDRLKIPCRGVMDIIGM